MWEALIASLKTIYADQAKWLNRSIAGESWLITGSFIQLSLLLVSSKENSDNEAQKSPLDEHEYDVSPAEKITTDKRNLDYAQLFQPLPEAGNFTAQKIWMAGTAGSGKSTLLQRMAYEWCQSYEDIPPVWLPEGIKAVIWVKLRDMLPVSSQPASWWRYEEAGKNANFLPLSSFASYLKAQGWIPEEECYFFDDDWQNIKTVLQRDKNNILYLVDGYDEIASLPRSDPVQQLFHDFFLKQPWLVVTSRPYYHCPAEPAHAFRHVELRGFSQANIFEYIDKHFQQQINLPEYTQLKALVNADLKIKSLAYVPINLETLCVIMSSVPILDLRAKNTTQLYIFLLFHFFKRAKEKGGLSHEFISEKALTDKISFLTSPKAIVLMQGLGQLAFIGLKKKQSKFQANTMKAVFRSILKAIYGEDENACFQDVFHAGFIRGLTWSVSANDFQGQGEFLHLTLQEYFAAYYIAQKWLDPKKREELIADIEQYKYAQSFARCWPFVVGLLAEQDNPLELADFIHVLDSPPLPFSCHYTLLRIRCLEELLPDKIPPAWQEWVVLFTQNLIGGTFYFALSEHQNVVCNELQNSPAWGKYLASYLINVFYQAPPGKWRPVFKIIQELGYVVATPDLLMILRKFLEENNTNFYGLTCETLGRLGPSAATPGFLATLLTLLQGADEAKRHSACFALTSLGFAAATPDFLARLLILLQSKEERKFRAACFALSALGSVAAKKEILDCLFNLLNRRTHFSNRVLVCQVIGAFGTGVKNTHLLITLLKKLLRDEEESVRLSACRAIIRLGSVAADPEIEEELLSLLQIQYWSSYLPKYRYFIFLSSLWHGLNYSLVTSNTTFFISSTIGGYIALFTQPHSKEIKEAACQAISALGSTADTPMALVRLSRLLHTKAGFIRHSLSLAINRLRFPVICFGFITLIGLFWEFFSFLLEGRFSDLLFFAPCFMAMFGGLSRLSNLMEINDEMVNTAAYEAINKLYPKIASPLIFSNLLLLLRDSNHRIYLTEGQSIANQNSVIITSTVLTALESLLKGNETDVRNKIASGILREWIQFCRQCHSIESLRIIWDIPIKNFNQIVDNRVRSDIVRIAANFLPDLLLVETLPTLLKAYFNKPFSYLPELLVKGIQCSQTRKMSLIFLSDCYSKRHEKYQQKIIKCRIIQNGQK
ncbi:MAG: hypothetical protein K2Q14_08135 [Gammaproteobacteria bacterium]|nr:hypothetical protein [Gammaproteobacteria bacterium]